MPSLFMTTKMSPRNTPLCYYISVVLSDHGLYGARALGASLG